ncbi:hypothetical protein PT974_01264 [Cladobotryum mycophilum]|uniref:Uncharacterized protein n=1 Tax=Cladobotryum mycophilum TaxID=491253 RepID=A0ABR0T4A0_9HYPO
MTRFSGEIQMQLCRRLGEGATGQQQQQQQRVSTTPTFPLRSTATFQGSAKLPSHEAWSSELGAFSANRSNALELC